MDGSGALEQASLMDGSESDDERWGPYSSSGSCSGSSSGRSPQQQGQPMPSLYQQIDQLSSEIPGLERFRDMLPVIAADLQDRAASAPRSPLEEILSNLVMVQEGLMTPKQFLDQLPQTHPPHYEEDLEEPDPEAGSPDPDLDPAAPLPLVEACHEEMKIWEAYLDLKRTQHEINEITASIRPYATVLFSADIKPADWHDLFDLEQTCAKVHRLRELHVQAMWLSEELNDMFEEAYYDVAERHYRKLAAKADKWNEEFFDPDLHENNEEDEDYEELLRNFLAVRNGDMPWDKLWDQLVKLRARHYVEVPLPRPIDEDLEVEAYHEDGGQGGSPGVAED